MICLSLTLPANGWYEYPACCTEDVAIKLWAIEKL